MAMLIEHQIESSGNTCDGTQSSVPVEIATRVSSTQSQSGNVNSLSSELASLATMTYTELHLAWRRHYRVVPPKKMSRDILELGIAWKIQENKLGGLGGPSSDTA